MATYPLCAKYGFDPNQQENGCTLQKSRAPTIGTSLCLESHSGLSIDKIQGAHNSFKVKRGSWDQGITVEDHSDCYFHTDYYGKSET